MPTLMEARFKPSADLRTWVSEFRVARISPGATYKLVHLPGGEASLMFRATGAGSGDLSAVGPLRRARYKTVGNAQFYVRVGLHPGRARRVLGLPLNELADRIVPLEAAWNSLGRSLCAQLIESEPAHVVPLIEEALRKFMRLRKAEPSVVNQIVRAIDAAPDVSVDEHALAAGLSGRQLRHLFRVELGMGPKHYSRIVRIKQLLAKAGGNRWAELALDAGFYDQAHMITDFRDLLDCTPDTFLSGWTVYLDKPKPSGERSGKAQQHHLQWNVGFANPGELAKTARHSVNFVPPNQPTKT